MRKRKNFALTLGEKHKMVSVMESCVTDLQLTCAYLWYIRVIGQRMERERELNSINSSAYDDLIAFKERMDSIQGDKYDEITSKENHE